MAIPALLCLFHVAFSQIRLTDDMARDVTLAGPADRIVSLAPSITEMLYALGAEDHLVGVTDYCNAPPAAALKPKVGGLINPVTERIVNLRPDLVLVSVEGNLRDDFLRLTGLNIPVFVTNPRSLEGIRRTIGQLGILTGREQAATELRARLKSREDSLRTTVPAARVPALLVVSVQPLIVVGRSTFLGELFELAGADNLGAQAPGTYPTLSRESVLRANPGVILLMTDAGADSSTLTRVFPEWARLPAVRNARVHTVNSDILSRPGPRAVDGLALLITLLHKRP